MTPVLELSALTKNYPGIRALDQVSFTVPKGSVFGILGPNGSGKTTLLGTVLGVLTATSGTYQWFGGMPVHQARQKMGTLLETPNFYHYLSAWDNLEITAHLKKQGLEDRERVLHLTGLYERRDSQFQTFSLGMKQRLAIAGALLGRPEVVVLDEPTNGLDPNGIAEIRQLILDLAGQGYTILMASHMLDEVEKVCTHMAILKKGQLLVSGAVAEVLRKEPELELAADNLPALASLLASLPGMQQVNIVGDKVKAILSGNLDAGAVNRFCAERGVYLHHIVLRRQSLETRFMELTEDA